MIYHVGFSKRNKTMVIEVRNSVDYLSCELYDYMGKRDVTKAHLKKHRYEILRLMQSKRPDVYGNLKFAVVD